MLLQIQPACFFKEIYSCIQVWLRFTLIKIVKYVLIYIPVNYANKLGCETHVDIQPVAVPTWSPESNALLLMSLTDAIVTVTIYTVASVPVMQVDVSGAVRVGTRAEFG